MNFSEKGNKNVSEKERLEKYKRFNMDALDLETQDLLEEIYEGKKDWTRAIDELGKMARKNIEKTQAEPETVLLPPDCGWCVFDPEQGDICLYGMRKPVRRVLLKWRKIKFFRCDLCEVLDIKKEEQVQLSKMKKPLIGVPIKIDLGTSYEVSRDLMLFCLKFRTLSPSKLTEHIFRVKGVHITPESISNWFRRHPEVKKAMEEQLEALKEMPDEEINRAHMQLRELENRKRKAKALSQYET